MGWQGMGLGNMLIKANLHKRPHGRGCHSEQCPDMETHRGRKGGNGCWELGHKSGDGRSARLPFWSMKSFRTVLWQVANSINIPNSIKLYPLGSTVCNVSIVPTLRLYYHFITINNEDCIIKRVHGIYSKMMALCLSRAAMDTKVIKQTFLQF